jgi:multiple sugar transport system ATP-binding protein
MSRDVSVSVRGIVIEFGPLRVLDRMSFDVGKGEFLVLLGPSGCGKSTLLNAIAGLLDVSEGEIWISGKNVTWEEPKDRGIGMVFQSYALYPRMTVERNMSFGLRIAGLPQKEIGARLARAAAMLQLDALLQRRPSELSGGQRQRVAIGRALVRNVDVFLFDEPLSNLDAQLRAELRIEIKKLHQSLGNTMIYVTHDQIEAMTLADRIAVMKAGAIQQLAPPQEIYNRPANRFVAGFIGSPAMSFLKGTLDSDHGAPSFAIGAIKLPLAGYPFAGSTAKGPAILGIRPEHVSIGGNSSTSSNPRYHCCRGKVQLVEPTGADTILWTDIAGEPITVRVDSQQGAAAGEEISYMLDLSRASLFDGETGNRL